MIVTTKTDVYNTDYIGAIHEHNAGFRCECMRCGNRFTLYHLEWTGLVCQKCKSDLMPYQVSIRPIMPE